MQARVLNERRKHFTAEGLLSPARGDLIDGERIPYVETARGQDGDAPVTSTRIGFGGSVRPYYNSAVGNWL